MSDILRYLGALLVLFLLLQASMLVFSTFVAVKPVQAAAQYNYLVFDPIE